MSNNAVEFVIFALVGASATAVYFTVANLAYLTPLLHGHPSSAAFIASLVSVLWSYLGHHHLTFRRSGAHQFYLPKFLTISVILSGMAVGVTYSATQFFGLSYGWATFGVTILYPIASFLLNRNWVFQKIDAKKIATKTVKCAALDTSKKSVTE